MCEEQESTSYLRLISLLIDVGTDAVYNYFISRIPNNDVASFLSQPEHRKKLHQLKNNNHLSKIQFKILTGPSPKAEDFDLSLLITLLGNLFEGIIDLPKTRLAKSDLTLGADLVRLRDHRNKIVGHRPRARISDQNFESYWNDLEEIIIRIYKAIDPTKESEITERIELYRTRNLDVQNKQQYKEKFEILRETKEFKDVVQSQKLSETLIAGTNEFDQFFRETPNRYKRYIRLLLEGGKFVLLAFLEKECKKQGQSVKALIKGKKDLLKAELENRGVCSQLENEPDEWYLLVLATVILTLFGENIKPKKAKLVRDILDALKDYAELALESLHEERFAPRCEHLAYTLRSLSSSLGEEIEDKCKEYIDRGIEDISKDNYLELLNMKGLKIKSLSDIYQEKVYDLKKSMKTMKESGIELGNELVLELKIIVLGRDDEKNKLAEDALYKVVLKAALKESEKAHAFEAVRQNVDTILDAIKTSAVVKAEDIKQKCIILSIRCHSCRGVLELLEYIESTLFQEHFFLLSDALSNIYGDVLVTSACLTLESLYTSLTKANDMQKQKAKPLSKHAGDSLSADGSQGQQQLSEDLSKKENVLESGKISESEQTADTQDGQFQYVAKDAKVFNDPIHGLIELHPLCVEIINTPEFERLRFVKQIGASYFVYPGAAHNRFEHSIGVCFLAGEMVKAIRKRQPELNITDEDVLCVQIAGLCHDMGHGPFSRVFDHVVIPKLVKGTTWKHEDGSVDMFSYMRKNNPTLTAHFKHYGINDREIDFIHELLLGPNGHDYSEWLKTTTKGKSENENERKHVFLYEVVNNKRNGIDVNKFDYLARDCFMLGIGNNFGYKRCIAFSRAIEVNGEWQICYRDKEISNLLEMFEMSYLLHDRAYKHKTVNGIEMMIAEALVAADKHLSFSGTGESSRKMSETIDDMAAFSLMTDEVFYRILNDPNPELKKSKELLQRILKRDIYKQVDEKPIGQNILDKETVKREIREIMHITNGEEPFVIDVVSLHNGNGTKNPMANINFYKKDNLNHAEPIPEEEVSRLLLKKWTEMHVRIYSKSKEEKEAVREAFKKWKSQ